MVIEMTAFEASRGPRAVHGLMVDGHTRLDNLLVTLTTSDRPGFVMVEHGPTYGYSADAETIAAIRAARRRTYFRPWDRLAVVVADPNPPARSVFAPAGERLRWVCSPSVCCGGAA